MFVVLQRPWGPILGLKWAFPSASARKLRPGLISHDKCEPIAADDAQAPYLTCPSAASSGANVCGAAAALWAVAYPQRLCLRAWAGVQCSNWFGVLKAMQLHHMVPKHPSQLTAALYQAAPKDAILQRVKHRPDGSIFLRSRYISSV